MSLDRLDVVLDRDELILEIVHGHLERRASRSLLGHGGLEGVESAGYAGLERVEPIGDPRKSSRLTGRLGRLRRREAEPRECADQQGCLDLHRMSPFRAVWL